MDIDNIDFDSMVTHVEQCSIKNEIEEQVLPGNEELLFNVSNEVSEAKFEEIVEEKNSISQQLKAVVKQETCEIEEHKEFLFVDCNEEHNLGGDKHMLNVVEDIDMKNECSHEMRQYKCSLCPSSFICSTTLETHAETHRKDNSYNCDYSSASYSDLIQHMSTNEVKSYKCTICPLSYASSLSLKSHIEANHPHERAYKCSICPSAFFNSRALTRHNKIHKGVRPHKCTICPSAFYNASDLKAHMRIHTGEKLHKCSMCDYSCTTFSKLKIHMRRHSGEKPHKCCICFSSFSDASYLRIHMRIHTGEKPYKCSVCNYSCTVAGRLINHMRTHTGEKPFKCRICPCSFTDSSNLKRHMEKHANSKQLKYVLCSLKLKDS